MAEAGDELTEGSVNPHDILKIKGTRGVQSYLLQEVQKVYRQQGVEINDKHIEVVVRQMMRKVKVEDSADTNLLPGGLVDMFEFESENRRVEAEGLTPASGKRTLLGITKASLATDSFLSAASFQETTRVLTEAAIKGKVDPLIGLKENVIIGKLIPAGTGMPRYKEIDIESAYDDAPISIAAEAIRTGAARADAVRGETGAGGVMAGLFGAAGSFGTAGVIDDEDEDGYGGYDDDYYDEDGDYGTGARGQRGGDDFDAVPALRQYDMDGDDDGRMGGYGDSDDDDMDDGGERAVEPRRSDDPALLADGADGDPDDF